MANAFIYHHNDDDGYCSGAIIYKYLEECEFEKYDKVITHKFDYQTILDLSEIKEDDTVYFVDYSFSNEENITALIGLVNKMKHGSGFVYWIDHHVSSKEVLETKMEPILGYPKFVHVIDTKVCGAVLCYWHALTNMPASDLKRALDYDNLPLFLRYIDSHDTWKHNMPKTPEFHIGMMFKNNMVYKYFDEILPESGDFFNWEVDLTRPFTQECIKKGEIIKPYTEIQNAKITNALSYETYIVYDNREYRCLVVNGFGNSSVFGDRIINAYDAVILYNYNGEQYKYSIYTAKEYVDCSVLAKALGKYTGLGGGGHRGAAGFQSTENVFKKGSTIVLHTGNPIHKVALAHKIPLGLASEIIKQIKSEGGRVAQLLKENQFKGENVGYDKLVDTFTTLSVDTLHRLQTIDLLNCSFNILSIDHQIHIDDDAGLATIYGEIQTINNVKGRALETVLQNNYEFNESDFIFFAPRILYMGWHKPENARLITFDAYDICYKNKAYNYLRGE